MVGFRGGTIGLGDSGPASGLLGIHVLAQSRVIPCAVTLHFVGVVEGGSAKQLLVGLGRLEQALKSADGLGGLVEFWVSPPTSLLKAITWRLARSRRSEATASAPSSLSSSPERTAASLHASARPR
ncbi:hypothetical protein VM57_09490 [Stenotrophomonas maltophilia]|uniref:Uncharacterized protein n=1 Tax=Stenotrophomonas maltophilia TaxID=40324 RepID=A0A0F5ZNX3_STEMA|nr:hypothetical protein VM57_09490 [Stenotrophomonas maltophilia]